MKEREAFLDKLRVAATCAVVLLHTVTGVMDHTDMGAYPMEKTVFLVILDLVCWCVPVFLLISGYLFLNPDRKITMGKMLLKYCRRIALALLVFGVPYACLEQIAVEKCFRWRMLGSSFLMTIRGESWSHLWYLYLILILYLLTPVLKKLLAVLPRPALYVLLSALFVGSSILPYLAKLSGMEAIPMLPDWGIYLFYYISGSLFVRRERNGIHFIPTNANNYVCTVNVERIGNPELKAAIKCVHEHNTAEEKGKTTDCSLMGYRKAGKGRAWLWPGLAAALAAAMACSRLSGNYTVQMAYNYPFTAALSLLLFAWGNSAPGNASAGRKTGDSFWKQAADISFTVYLVHPVFLNTAYKFLHITPLSFPIGISLPVFWMLTLLLSAAVAWMLCKIPLLRNYVL